MKRLLFTVLVPLNSALLAFLLFENRMVLPPALQVAGRMHPLLLHFPIVLFIIFVALLLVPRSYRDQPLFRDLLDYLLLVSALTTSVTALMGFMLSSGGEYASDTLTRHKWTGTIVSFLLFIISAFRQKLQLHPVFLRGTAIAVLALVIVAGHYGAVLTHGEQFLLGPLQKEEEKKLPPFDEALVFADLVKPVLDKKCMSCHNSDKAKGDLIMETRELLLKGGKEGKLWDSASHDLGLMMRRIHLPLKDKKHMPPSGKPQLTPEDVLILESWIRKGADFDKRIADLSTTDTLYLVARKIFGSETQEVYAFEPADEQTIRQLSNSNRIIAPIAIGSAALRVQFFNAASYKDRDLEELLLLKDNITELSLARMPISDRSLDLLKQFRELRRLNLNFTPLKGEGLAAISSLPLLKKLSLSGTPVEASALSSLENFSSLKEVFLWNTRVTEKDVPDLENLNRKIVYHTGFSGDTTVLQLTPPILPSEQQVFNENLTLNVVHSLAGTGIRYTLDGSDPDSLRSPEYTAPIVLNRSTMVKARAFKSGWMSSDVTRHYYFKQTYKPDSCVLIRKGQAPESSGRARLLIDGEKSDINFASGRWFGFSTDPMEYYLFFHKPVTVTNVTLSILQDISASIMPPQRVQIWGGPDRSRLTLLSTVHPSQPLDMEYREILPVENNFPPTDLQVIKVLTYPLPALPDWHQNKGHAGRVFIDEIFVN